MAAPRAEFSVIQWLKKNKVELSLFEETNRYYRHIYDLSDNPNNPLKEELSPYSVLYQQDSIKARDLSTARNAFHYFFCEGIKGFYHDPWGFFDVKLQVKKIISSYFATLLYPFQPIHGAKDENVQRDKSLHEALIALDKNGNTPLHYLFLNPMTEDGETLIKRIKSFNPSQKADITRAQTKNGQTILHLACGNDHSCQTLQLLCDNLDSASLLAAITREDLPERNTPLHIACACIEQAVFLKVATLFNIDDKFHVLAQAALKKNSKGQNALHVACANKTYRSGIAVDAICKIFSKKSLSDEDKEEAVRMQALIDRDQDGNTPLHLACAVESSHHIIYGLFFDLTPAQKVTVALIKDNKGDTALHLTYHSQLKENLIAILRNLSPNQKFQLLQEINLEGQTPLHLACLARDVTIMTLLLENLTEEQGVTLLTKANKKGETPIHIAHVPLNPHLIAALYGNLSVPNKAKIMIHKNARGLTSLHEICHQGSLGMLRDTVNSLTSLQLYGIIKTDKSILQALVRNNKHSNQLQIQEFDETVNRKLGLLTIYLYFEENFARVAKEEKDSNMKSRFEDFIQNLLAFRDAKPSFATYHGTFAAKSYWLWTGKQRYINSYKHLPVDRDEQAAMWREFSAFLQEENSPLAESIRSRLHPGGQQAALTSQPSAPPLAPPSFSSASSSANNPLTTTLPPPPYTSYVPPPSYTTPRR